MPFLYRLIAGLVGTRRPPVDTSKVRKVLIADFSFIGDVLMTSNTHVAILGGLLEDLHARIRPNIPGAELQVFGFTMVGEILSMLDVDRPVRLHAAPRNGKLAQVRSALALRKERFDLAVHVNTGLWVNFLVWLTGAKVRVGYDFGGRGCFNNVRLPIATRTVKTKFRARECAELLEGAFGWKVPAEIARLRVPAAAVTSVAGMLRDWGVGTGDLLIGIHTSNRQGREIRCWDEAKYAELANVLIERHNAKIVFTDMESDRPFVQPILDGITRKDRIVDAIGKTDIPQFCALLDRIDVLVTINTASMHFALARRRPFVAVLGYGPAYLYFPPGDERYQFEEDPAITAHYDVNNIVQTEPSRIREIPVAKVLEKVEYLLRTTTKTASR